ncbi:MAG: dihydropyrimidinase [Dehalococcoidia bacterium]
MDLAIRNGTIVSATSTFAADIGVEDGRVVQVGGMVPDAAHEFDAVGRFLLPGCVDIHTHLSAANTAPPLDDFVSGTRAAAAGGVTTVCDFAWQTEGGSLLDAVGAARADAAAKSLIDFTFHTVLRDPHDQAIAELDAVAGAGAGLKIFMSAPRFDHRSDRYLRALQAAGRAGILTAIHAEDASIIGLRTSDLLAAGKSGPEFFPDSRPVLAEVVAVQRAIAYAEAAAAPIYLVHLSSAAAIAPVTAARRRGLPVFAETRPIYLYLTDERFAEPDRRGALYVGQPPLRPTADVDAIWQALRGGQIDTVCTDHIPYTAARKLDPTLDFSRIPPGVSNLETLLPMLYSEGVRTGRITLSRMVEVLAANPARLAGLAPRKGAIVPGADADIVIFDPERTRTIRASESHSACDYDVFEGRSVTGWPETTIARGDVIFDHGRVTGAPGRGQFVPRTRFAGL